MGPGTSSDHRKLVTSTMLTPPYYHLENDRSRWRQKVKNWVTVIKRAVDNGDDGEYKNVYISLARHLIQLGLTSHQQSVVENAHRNNKINYDQQNQIQAVQEIIDLVASDPPMTIVTRLMNSFQNVANCRRTRNESLEAYVIRFSGLASEHLMLAGASSSSKVGEVLAITMVNNANLGETTNTAAQMQLLHLAYERERNCRVSVIEVHGGEHKIIGNAIGLIDECEKEMDKFIEEPNTNQEAQGEDITEDLKQCIKDVHTRLRIARGSLNIMNRKVLAGEPTEESGPRTEIKVSDNRATLNFDDAIIVLKNLQGAPRAPGPSNYKHDLDNLIHRSMFSGNRNTDKNIPRWRNTQNNRPYIRKRRFDGDRNRVSKTCTDCGSRLHVRGDKNCMEPSFYTRKSRERSSNFRPNALMSRNNSKKQNRNAPRHSTQLSLACGRGAESDFCRNAIDPNPIIDTGCPKSVGGINYALLICNSLRIPFELEPLDCEPFYHGYGMECSEAKLVVGIWNLPLSDLHGTEFKLPFYIVKGDGYLLVGNNIAKQSKLMNNQNLIIIPPNTESLSDKELTLPTYHSEGNRTRLMVIPSNMGCLNSYFNSVKSLQSTEECAGESKFSNGKFCKWFAFKFHAFTHFTLPDMVHICKTANVLTPVLRQALQLAIEKCTSCKSTNRPLNSKKISFDKLLRTFNDHVQLDFFFIKELTQLPILHIRDKATGYSETVVQRGRDIEEMITEFKKLWMYKHGNPNIVSADQEFAKPEFMGFLKTNKIKFEERPARRHNKTGIVEAGHTAIRMIALKIYKDAKSKQFLQATGISGSEILTKATFLSNVLRGNSKLSSFELARGYLPSLCGLPMSTVSKELYDAFFEQQALHSIKKLISSRAPRPLKEEALPPKTCVFYFVKETKRGQWRTGYVQETSDHVVTITTRRNGSGHKLKVAYEDIRLMPKSSLLKDLNKLDMHVRAIENTASEFENIPSRHSPKSTEETLWCFHPRSKSYIAESSNRPYNQRNYDVDVPIIGPDIKKDVGDYQPTIPSQFPLELESSEQEILQKIRATIGDKSVSESTLQFAPEWIIEKSKRKERDNYKEAIQITHRRDIPRNSNVISSHYFFVVKHDGESGKLKLKCRIVPHGNRDKEKDDIRSDSQTAQFPVIRSVLSISALFKLKLATLDISKAYMQSGDLSREIYMRPPDAFMTNRGELWKIIKPAYGLVESGRLWQITIESWLLSDEALETVPGLPQLFYKKNKEELPILVIAKVVDDLLIAGQPEELEKFHTAISKRFQVGRFTKETSIVFYRLHIFQHENYNLDISMSEFMETITPIEITKERKKEHDSPATKVELTAFLSLAGKLNFLGHGCLPVAAFAASYIQQKISDLKVSTLKEANSVLKEVQLLIPKMLYISPANTQDTKYIAFSDAAQGKSSYGQTGYISGISTKSMKDQIYHAIDWHSSRQSRVSFSSIGSEILAAATSADRASLYSESLKVVCQPSIDIPLTLVLDSLGLHSTISTLHEGRDYRLRPTVARLRDSYECGEISELLWIPGTCNIADALTKRNLAIHRTLNNVLNTGKIEDSIFKISKTC